MPCPSGTCGCGAAACSVRAWWWHFSHQWVVIAFEMTERSEIRSPRMMELDWPYVD